MKKIYASCFSGRIKAEMRYGTGWRRASDSEATIAFYIDFYNNRGIKT